MRPDPKLQAKVRELASYSYGTSSGVDQKGAPNPWGLRLSGYEFAVTIGIGVAAINLGLAAINVIPIPGGIPGFLAGSLIFVSGALRVRKWMQWRSIPEEI